MKNKLKYLLFAAIVLLLNACATTQTFYIVRHAEKAANSEDPGLSQAGIDRGVALEKLMADKKLDTVFTSNFKRTILTGLSVALPQGLPQVALKQAPQNELNTFIARLKNIHSTKNLLVVGHTNSVPPIVQALSGQQIPNIAETDYNNLYIVTIKGKQISLVHTNYGR
jgi:2,3-bisphosphoglycerate-dependent phosphoglycerate mutase